MYYYVCGLMTYGDGTTVVLDVGGVGYALTVTANTYQTVAPSLGTDKKVKLYTHLAVREDGVELFGFATESEKKSFLQLLTVSGIGPKAALSVLSWLTPEKLALAVCSGDAKIIAKANGIGPKTAARIILELKDKLEIGNSDVSFGFTPSPVVSANPQVRTKVGEAVDALVVLGYARSEAMSALADADPNASIEEMIRLGLKKMMKY